MPTKTQAHSLFSDQDIHLFREGRHYRLYQHFGSHPLELNGKAGVYFAVYAPAAEKVEVIGNFNHWQGEDYPLRWSTVEADHWTWKFMI